MCKCGYKMGRLKKIDKVFLGEEKVYIGLSMSLLYVI